MTNANPIPESDQSPASADPFADLPAPLAAAIRERGFLELTPVQQAVSATEAGQNLRISSETGSGKTVALGLVLAEALLPKPDPETGALAKPERRRGPAAFVITPTRELAMQVQGELEWLFSKVRGVTVEVVTGGVDIRGDRRRLSRRPEILVATPGRLLDHINSGTVDCSDVAHVVLDEADQMLDMGFRDELDAIVAALPEERASHLVSATFPREVIELANRFQGGKALRIAGTAHGEPHRDIEVSAYLVSEADLYPALVNLLLLAQGRRCLVFVRRRIDAAELASKLAGDGFSALPFSGDLSQAQRTRTLEAFRHGIVNTLISTDVAARGIDVPDIATVIHADLPVDVANYVHRSGRTGRAGRKGTSMLLVPQRAERRIRSLLRGAKVEATWGGVPGPGKVHKALIKRMRRDLHARLELAAGVVGEDAEQTVSEPITEADRDYAAKLLADHDPALVVATLLQMARPPLAREPMPVAGPQAAAGGRAPGDARDRGPRDAREPRDRGPREARSKDDRRGEWRDWSNGFVRFEINWGEQAGATPGRLLAHVCRRGGITSRSIGPVRIGRRSSVFEVAGDVAEDFAHRVAKPDARDPKLWIRRAEQER